MNKRRIATLMVKPTLTNGDLIEIRLSNNKSPDMDSLRKKAAEQRFKTGNL